jgi:hypothetical protein
MSIFHAVAVKVSTGVVGACSPDNSGSFRLTVPTPAPTPNVPYVVVTNYPASNCQGSFSGTFNLIIGACTALPGSGGYGVASLSGSVRHDECTHELILALLRSCKLCGALESLNLN